MQIECCPLDIILESCAVYCRRFFMCGAHFVVVGFVHLLVNRIGLVYWKCFRVILHLVLMDFIHLTWLSTHTFIQFCCCSNKIDVKLINEHTNRQQINNTKLPFWCFNWNYNKRRVKALWPTVIKWFMKFKQNFNTTLNNTSAIIRDIPQIQPIFLTTAHSPISLIIFRVFLF